MTHDLVCTRLHRSEHPGKLLTTHAFMGCPRRCMRYRWLGLDTRGGHGAAPSRRMSPGWLIVRIVGRLAFILPSVAAGPCLPMASASASGALRAHRPCPAVAASSAVWRADQRDRQGSVRYVGHRGTGDPGMGPVDITVVGRRTLPQPHHDGGDCRGTCITDQSRARLWGMI